MADSLSSAPWDGSAKKSAARKLKSIYARFNLPIPDSLKNMAS